MHKFAWIDAKSIQEAVGEANTTVSEAILSKDKSKSVVYKAGGIDLLDLMKEGIVNPSKIVHVRNIPHLGNINYNPLKGLDLGANISLAEMAAHHDIKEKYPALHQAVASASTPQIRNIATLGGNLAQRTRCWYFRSEHHQCYRKGSGTCFARIGENQQHAIFNNEKCASVHASSIATALMVYNAAINVVNTAGENRTIPIESFFVSPDKDSRRENVLEAGDLITSVVVPSFGSNNNSYYIKQGERESHDWPIADVAVSLDIEGSRLKNVKIVLGAAAPVPIFAKESMKYLEGKNWSDKFAKKAAELAVQNATPLSKNAHKIAIIKTIVYRALKNSIN